MSDWNPDRYLQFKSERTQPSFDLVARIELDKPKTIIDIGCGPGNSTQVLALRWRTSDVTGLDNSKAMIEKAGTDFPKQHWMLGDVRDMNGDTTYDLVFSSATLQWVPDHESLLPRLISLVNPGGAIAIQIPRFKTMPVSRAIDAVSKREKWSTNTKGCDESFTYYDPAFYYDVLVRYVRRIEMWETGYYHVLDSHESILDFVRTTGLRPYLERLPDEAAKKAFEKEVLDEYKNDYGVRSDGKVLFPFNRLFFIGYKG